MRKRGNKKNEKMAIVAKYQLWPKIAKNLIYS